MLPTSSTPVDPVTVTLIESVIVLLSTSFAVTVTRTGPPAFNPLNCNVSGESMVADTTVVLALVAVNVNTPMLLANTGGEVSFILAVRCAIGLSSSVISAIGFLTIILTFVTVMTALVLSFS